MSAFVDSLNLRPAEKRAIVVIGVVIFVVLNFLFVFPRFKDKARIEALLRQTNSDIDKYKAGIALDINPTNGYVRQLEQLQKQTGLEASRFSSDIQLQRTVADQARLAGVEVQDYAPVNTSHIGSTNAGSQFYEQQSMTITATATDANLVKFLYNIGNDPAMIRVLELNFSPADANRYQLKCRITLTADYKKTAGARPPPPRPGMALIPTTHIPTNNVPKPPKRTNALGQPPIGPIPPPNFGGARSNRPPMMPPLPGQRRMVPPSGAPGAGYNQ